MENVELIENAIEWAKKRGFKSIKANIENYDTPAIFSRKDADPFIPDITGLQSSGKCYVEIAKKTDDVQTQISKWKLLSKMAEIKGGKLYLLAPRGHKAFTENIVKNHNLEARIVSL